MNKPLTGVTRRKLRSSEWFNNSHNPGMTALYLERYLNYGLTRNELQSGKPIIGIAQTGNDLSPCNRHHIELAHRVRECIRAAGAIAIVIGAALVFLVFPDREGERRLLRQYHAEDSSATPADAAT